MGASPLNVQSNRRAGLVRAGRTSSLKMAHKFEAGRKMRVAVVGGGPAGACAAEIFAQVSTFVVHLSVSTTQFFHMWLFGQV